ncbi:MAG TPA: hypothetical protein VLL54_11140 [Pyrinomonadaceae bacterium]|nr:hypothetical protein [Pyrinomonadaceae bacterium]
MPELKYKVLLVVLLVLVLALAVVAKQRKLQRMSAGPWAGPNIRLTVEVKSATVDFACARGTIDGPLTFDSKGRFTWHGTYFTEGPGPTRIDQEAGNPAIYAGSIKGDMMTLTVKLLNTSQLVDTFTLKRNAASRVFKCK